MARRPRRVEWPAALSAWTLIPDLAALVTAASEVLFDQEPPILFDEWQIEPTLWDLVRRQVDDRSPVKGQFVLTGSSTPNDDARRHSGAGRISTLRMRPMSLYESGHSTGAVSLANLFTGGTPAALDPGASVPQLIERIVVGGWPDLIDASVQDAQQWLRDYLRNVVEVDVQQLGVRPRPKQPPQAVDRSRARRWNRDDGAVPGSRCWRRRRHRRPGHCGRLPEGVTATDDRRGRLGLGSPYAIDHAVAQVAGPLYERPILGCGCPRRWSPTTVERPQRRRVSL